MRGSISNNLETDLPTYIASLVTGSSCPPPGLAATCGVKRTIEDQMVNGYQTSPLVEVELGSAKELNVSQWISERKSLKSPGVRGRSTPAGKLNFGISTPAPKSFIP